MEIAVVIVLFLIVVIIIGKLGKTPSIPAEYLSPLTNDMSIQIYQKGYEILPNLFMGINEKREKMTAVMAEIESMPAGERKKIMAKIVIDSYKSLISMHLNTDASFASTLLSLESVYRKSLCDGTTDWDNWGGVMGIIDNRRKSLCIEDDIEIKPSKKMSSISFAVKGLRFRDDSEQSAAYGLKVGDELILEEDSDNEYDPFAIKVFTIDGYHIGYVEMTKSECISENMGRLVKAKVKKISNYNDLYIYGLAYFE